MFLRSGESQFLNHEKIGCGVRGERYLALRMRISCFICNITNSCSVSCSRDVTVWQSQKCLRIHSQLWPMELFTPCACVQGVMQLVLSVVYRCRHRRHHENCQIWIWRYRHIVSATNPSKSAKNWLQYASNISAWPTSIINRAFLLVTPISHTYCWPWAFCSCAQLAKCKQVKVVNKYMQLSEARLMQMQHSARGMCSREL